MAAPKGNQNHKGKRGGGGRPSAYHELANAQTLAALYFEDHSQEEIENKISKGRFSLKDRHILNGMEGDQRAIDVVIKKLFPDKQELGGMDGGAIDLNVGLKTTISKIYGGGESGKNGL